MHHADMEFEWNVLVLQIWHRRRIEVQLAIPRSIQSFACGEPGITTLARSCNSLSTTAGSERVLVSPSWLLSPVVDILWYSCGSAIFLRILRIILPERVFGSPLAAWITSGAENFPSLEATAAFSSFSSSGVAWVPLLRMQYWASQQWAKSQVNSEPETITSHRIYCCAFDLVRDPDTGCFCNSAVRSECSLYFCSSDVVAGTKHNQI